MTLPLNAFDEFIDWEAGERDIPLTTPTKTVDAAQSNDQIDRWLSLAGVLTNLYNNLDTAVDPRLLLRDPADDVSMPQYQGSAVTHLPIEGSLPTFMDEDPLWPDIPGAPTNGDDWPFILPEGFNSLVSGVHPVASSNNVGLFSQPVQYQLDQAVNASDNVGLRTPPPSVSPQLPKARTGAGVKKPNKRGAATSKQQTSTGESPRPKRGRGRPPKGLDAEGFVHSGQAWGNGANPYQQAIRSDGKKRNTKFNALKDANGIAITSKADY